MPTESSRKMFPEKGVLALLLWIAGVAGMVYPWYVNQSGGVVVMPGLLLACLIAFVLGAVIGGLSVVQEKGHRVLGLVAAGLNLLALALIFLPLGEWLGV